MRINATSAGTFGQADGQTPHHTSVPAHEPKTESRALVVVEPPAVQENKQDRPMAYRDASFLAHLIATRAQMPQTRSRRRAEPAEVLAAYRAMAKLVA